MLSKKRYSKIPNNIPNADTKAQIITPYKIFLSDMESWVSNGEIIVRETVAEGIENSVDAFLALFSGDNFGKMIVKL